MLKRMPSRDKETEAIFYVVRAVFGPLYEGQRSDLPSTSAPRLRRGVATAKRCPCMRGSMGPGR